MPLIYRLFAAVLMSLMCLGQAGASASLPQQELDLATLDLNGTPFRHFHLGAYRGWVLNPQVIPGESQDTGLDALQARKLLRKMPTVLGLEMVKPHYPNGGEINPPSANRELQQLYHERMAAPLW